MAAAERTAASMNSQNVANKLRALAAPDVTFEGSLREAFLAASTFFIMSA